MEEVLQDRAGAIDRAGAMGVKMVELELAIVKDRTPEKGAEQESETVKPENCGFGKVLWTECADYMTLYPLHLGFSLLPCGRTKAGDLQL
jgi:hypothetical protein